MKIVPKEEHHERVLIVEDHTRTREALRVILERKGYSVTEAGTFREAREILASPGCPDVAVLDWMLPDGTGLDLCKAVRARETGHRTYVIIITGRDGGEDIAQALSAGADDFIHKPCGAVELMARVRNGLRTVGLERTLFNRIVELETALKDVKQLKKMLKKNSTAA